MYLIAIISATAVRKSVCMYISMYICTFSMSQLAQKMFSSQDKEFLCLNRIITIYLI